MLESEPEEVASDVAVPVEQAQTAWDEDQRVDDTDPTFADLSPQLKLRVREELGRNELTPESATDIIQQHQEEAALAQRDAEVKAARVADAARAEGALTTQAAASLRTGDVRSALADTAQNSKVPLFRALAQRFTQAPDRANPDLLDGVTVTVADNLTDAEGTPVRGRVTMNRDGYGATVELDAKTGADETTLLHEVTHAATLYNLTRPEAELSPDQRAAKQKLKSLLAKAKASLGAKRPELSSLAEFASQAMTNLEFRKELDAIPYTGGKSVWQEFKSRILQLLGVKAPKTTSQAATEAVEALFGQAKATPETAGQTYYSKADKAFQNSTLAPEIIRLARERFHTEESIFSRIAGAIKKVRNAAFGKNSTGFIDVVRTTGTDHMASLEGKLDDRTYHGALRDAAGNLKSTVVARQALDFDKMLPAIFREGGIRIDPATRYVTVAQMKAKLDDIYSMITAWGKTENMGFEAAYSAADRILEVLRVNELIKLNAIGAADVDIHLRTPSDAIDYAAIKEVVDKYNNDPRLQAIQKLLDEVRIPMIDLLEQTGRITTEVAQEYRTANFYVPFDRVSLDDQVKFFRAAKTAKGGIASAFRDPKLQGSKMRQTKNVIESFYSTMSWLTQEVLKQNAMNSLLEDSLVAGLTRKVSESELHKYPYHVAHYEKGERVYYGFDSQYDVMAFQALPEIADKFVSVAARVANLQRTFVTAEPTFAVAQLAKDAVGALVIAGNVSSPLRFLWDCAWNFSKLTGNTTLNLAKGLLGFKHGITEVEMSMRRAGVASELEYARTDPAADVLLAIGARKRKFAGSSILGEAVHALKQITHNSDIAIRKALYDDVMRHYNDPILAAHNARELINFRRAGSSGLVNSFSATVPFFKTSLQVLDLLYRSATGKGNAMGLPARVAQAKFARHLAMFGGLCFLYSMLKPGDGDDEESKKFRGIDERFRDSHFIFGDNFKIPVRGDLVIVKKAADLAVDWYTRQGTPEEITAKQVLKSLMAATVNGLMPPAPIPTLFKLPLEVAFDLPTTLTRNPVVGTYMRGLDPSVQATSRTSEAAKQLAEEAQRLFGIEVSPLRLEAAARGFVASYYGHFAAATNQLLNPDRVEETPLHKMAIVGAFMFDPKDVQNADLDDFYDLAAVVTRRQNTLRELERTNPDKVLPYSDAHKAELSADKLVSSRMQELAAVRRNLKFLNSTSGAQTMPDKAQRIREIDSLETAQREIVKGLNGIRAQLGIEKP